MKTSKPNLLFILFDDLGFSDLGCYGGEIRTPNIDALAMNGVRFEGMYNSARCCPSRASLMTGLYPPQAGIGDFVSREPHPTKGPAHLGRLRDDCHTIAEVLKPAGYNCYFSGKWHMHSATGPIDRGFDEFYGYRMDHSHDQYDASFYVQMPEGRNIEIVPSANDFYATDVFSEYGLEFIKQGQQAHKPWLLYLSHSSPHFPLQAPKHLIDSYVETYMQGWDVLRAKRFERMKELGVIAGDKWNLTDRSMVPVDDASITHGYAGKPNPSWDSLDEDRKKDLAHRMAIFAAMVTRVDEGVGRIVSHLGDSGDLDNTLIMITSDNGACYEWGPFGFDQESRAGFTKLHTGDELKTMGGPGTYHAYGSAWANLCNTPLRMYKHFTYEGGIKAPLIAHWPSEFQSNGKWIRGLTHTVDLMPTFRCAAKAEYPETRNGMLVPPEEGIDLTPACSDVSLPERTLFFSHQQARAVIDKGWKIVWSKRTPQSLKWELYNVDEDPCEVHDVSDSHPELVASLAAKWEGYRKRVGLEEFEPWDVPEKEAISD